MNKDNLLYKIEENKSKILLVFSILFLSIIVIIGVVLFRKSNLYQSFNSASSSKYILASNIIGVNHDGTINLYNSKNGKLVDELKLNGDYLIDSSDDFTSIYMLNTANGEVFKISSKNDKIKKEKEDIVVENPSIVDSFDYDNGSIAVLYNNKKSFFIKHTSSKTAETFSPNVTDDIDLFRIVKDNLIFTSGEFIYSKGLSTDIANFKESTTSDGGTVKIHIGEKSNYIHEFEDKVFIHNNFGEDRGISILLDINPENLYIQNLIEFNNITNSLITNSNDSKLYINEISDTAESKVRQIIKYNEIEKFNERLGFKYTSETILDNENAYGMLGYVYYKDSKGVNIYNLKSQEKDLTLEISNDFFAPLY